LRSGSFLTGESKKLDVESDGAAAAERPAAKEQTLSGFEYLDHTADVQLHSWAPSLKEALELVVVAMFGYITELGQVEESEELDVQVEATGHDMDSLLYSLMDEFLFQFCTEYSVCKRVEIVSFDRENWKIVARGFGETYDKKKHVPGEKSQAIACKSKRFKGTEIKAITYSNMQIHESPDKAEVYVIVDI
jgi:SHS2 domain-containing protein